MLELGILKNKLQDIDSSFNLHLIIWSIDSPLIKFDKQISCYAIKARDPQ